MKYLLFIFFIITMLLASCVSTTQKIGQSVALTPIVFPPPPSINEDKAVVLALQYLPYEATLESSITTGFSSSLGKPNIYGFWTIQFIGIFSRDQLKASGWYEDSLGPVDITSYSTITIILDATTGNLFQKVASPFLPKTTAPSVNTKLDSDKAKIIAAHYIPSDILVQAAIKTQFLNADESVPSPDAWIVYFTVNISPKQMGWREDEHTHLDRLPAGEEYFQLAVEINADTGDLIQKAAFAPSVTTPTYVPIVPAVIP